MTGVDPPENTFGSTERDVERIVVEDPQVQGGAPIFRGTRVLVRNIAAALESGVDESELREDYALSDEQLAAARVYAAAKPLDHRRND